LHLYSDRLSWKFSQNSISRLADEKRRRTVKLLDLTVSNPTSVFDYPHAALQDAFRRLPKLNYSPDPFGLVTAREAISRYYAQQYVVAPVSHLALTASTSEAYAFLFKLLCASGDEVLVPSPSYPLFDYLAALENVRAIPYRLAYDGSWFIDFDHLQAQMSPRCRAIVVVNPNNPTGSFLKTSEHARLSALARKCNIPVIADEVFMSFELGSHSDRVKTFIGDASFLSFSLNGLSKTVGMPQMKLAWICVNGPAEEVRAACSRLELILDTYLSVNTPVQLALPDLLAAGLPFREYIHHRVGANLLQASKILAGGPVHVLHTEGGWSLILQLPNTRSEEDWMLRLLEEQDTLLQPGFFFDMPPQPYAVASLITEPGVFSDGINRLRHLVERDA